MIRATVAPRALQLAMLVVLAACDADTRPEPAAQRGQPDASVPASSEAFDAVSGGAGTEPSSPRADQASDAGAGDCTTRISYGSGWMPPADHSADPFDDASGLVTWDGACRVDAEGRSFAELSNGWRVFFAGHDGCVLALDVRGSCAPAGGCTTRTYYGPTWDRPGGHPEDFDDVAGVLTTDATCKADGDLSYLTLSNGWEPHFAGPNSCGISFRYSQCGGLFANPLVAEDCPDPDVLRDGEQYVMTCTSSAGGFPLRTSKDLVHWQLHGAIFTAETKPEWAVRSFWAPEIHHIGDRYLAYFNARHVDGDLAIGVASASSALGPYRDTGAPLLRADPGAIDVHQFQAPDGARYLIWKVDGNSDGRPTTIKIQPLAEDGLSLTGTETTLLSNMEAWEANVVEAPEMIYEAGYYYLFYSGNSFASPGYAEGVARSTSVTGPFTKAPRPILVSSARWAGPGHGSIVRAPGGEWVFVFHAWVGGRIGQSTPGRQVLLTRIGWKDGWPTMLGAPSSLSQPPP